MKLIVALSLIIARDLIVNHLTSYSLQYSVSYFHPVSRTRAVADADASRSIRRSYILCSRCTRHCSRLPGMFIHITIRPVSSFPHLQYLIRVWGQLLLHFGDRDWHQANTLEHPTYLMPGMKVKPRLLPQYTIPHLLGHLIPPVMIANWELINNCMD